MRFETQDDLKHEEQIAQKIARRFGHRTVKPTNEWSHIDRLVYCGNRLLGAFEIRDKQTTFERMKHPPVDGVPAGVEIDLQKAEAIFAAAEKTKLPVIWLVRFYPEDIRFVSIDRETWKDFPRAPIGRRKARYSGDKQLAIYVPTTAFTPSWDGKGIMKIAELLGICHG